MADLMLCLTEFAAFLKVKGYREKGKSKETFLASSKSVLIKLISAQSEEIFLTYYLSPFPYNLKNQDRPF